MSLLHAHLQSGHFNFSYTYEVTHTLQRQSALKDNTQYVWERVSHYNPEILYLPESNQQQSIVWITHLLFLRCLG